MSDDVDGSTNTPVTGVALRGEKMIEMLRNEGAVQRNTSSKQFSEHEIEGFSFSDVISSRR